MVSILHIGKKGVAIDPASELARTLDSCDANGDARVDVYEIQGSWWQKLKQLVADPKRIGRNRSCIAESFSQAGELAGAPKHHVMQVTAIEYFLEVAPQLDQLIATSKDFRANNTNDSFCADDGDGFYDREFDPEYFSSTVAPQMKAWKETGHIGHVARLFQAVIRYFEGDVDADEVWGERSSFALKWIVGSYVGPTGARKVEMLTSDQVPALLHEPLQQYANELSRELAWLSARTMYECNECPLAGSFVSFDRIL